MTSNFICAISDSMTICFPRKDACLFQPAARSSRGIEKSKKLEVYNILKSAVSKRRNPRTVEKLILVSINPIGVVICLKQKKKYGSIARSGHLSKHLISASQHSASDQRSM
jgi:hypothetical protein